MDINKKIDKKVKKYISNIESFLASNGQLESLDIGQLESLQNSYKTFLYAQNDIDINGYFTSNRFGDKIANPAIKVSNDAKVQMNKVLELMNITQKGRYKDVKIEDDTDTPLDSWIKENK